jgi:hypothetical protein
VDPCLQPYTAQQFWAALSRERPYNRIRCRVGDQGRRPQRGVLLEQSVENDHRVAQGARHHKAEESDAASRRVVHVLHAFAAAEVTGIASRMDRADRHDEPQSVGGRQLSTAQVFGQRQPDVHVDQPYVGVGDRIGAHVALLDPRESRTRQGWDLWPDQRLEANVARLGQQDGTHADGQIVGARSLFTDVSEVRGETGPGLDLQQQFGQLHSR